MDFTAVLQIAKQNREEVKDGGKYYKTKFAPPKKESKESRRLSDNIQKFLQKREEEEKQKMIEQKKKVANLLAMRDEKSKNKIRKMLKVTKSANKSVLDDACSSTQTAVTLAGAEQPDQDDYGYVSNEANAFYQKYIEKVKDVQDEKGFAPSRPQSLKDLTGTKERVKAAITREKDEKVNGERRRSRTSTESVTSKSSKSGSSSSKTLYDPQAERKEEERKREEERKKARNRRPPPPIMDFRELLKLAEKKQHEPIEIVQEVKKEPERLLTSKEKQQLEEQRRAKEARERRERDIKEGRIKPSISKPATTSSSSTSTSTKLSSTSKPNMSSSKPGSSTKSDDVKRMSDSSTFKKPQTSTAANSRPSTANSKTNLTMTKPATKISSSSDSSINNIKAKSKSDIAKPYNGPTREFPPKSNYSGPITSKPRAGEPQKNDLRRGPSSSGSRPGLQNGKVATKRRVIDDYEDDDEYDSEMDDFIDDGDADIDYSSVIQNMFGYNRAKYRDFDDDDVAMESNFAQVQREEYISNKIGIKEDLEDMRLEALHKERKLKKLKKSKLI